jgi:hypothetical protein
MTVCLCTANRAEMDSDFGPGNYGPQPSDALEKVLEIMTEIESLSKASWPSILGAPCWPSSSTRLSPPPLAGLDLHYSPGGPARTAVSQPRKGDSAPSLRRAVSPAARPDKWLDAARAKGKCQIAERKLRCYIVVLSNWTSGGQIDETLDMSIENLHAHL